jgi:hypothetical protein
MRYIVILAVFLAGCAHCKTELSVSYHRNDADICVTIRK